MTASAGTTNVLGSKFVNKNKVNTDDNHDSITINLIGLASGAECARMFLIKAKKVDYD